MNIFHDVYFDPAYAQLFSDQSIAWVMDLRFRFVLGFCKWAMNWDLGE